MSTLFLSDEMLSKILLSKQNKSFETLYEHNISILSCIEIFDHESVKKLCEICFTIIDKEKKRALDIEDEETANALYLVKTYFDLMQSYSLLWRQFHMKKYRQAWDTTQDCNDLLRTLKRFEPKYAHWGFEELETNLGEIEKLYPYNVFSSIEVVSHRQECSICGKSPFDPECNHTPGELYEGEIAHFIIKDGQPVGSALVRNPADKRCVIEAVGNKPLLNEETTKGLVLLAENIPSPFLRIRVLKRKRKIPIKKFKSMRKNEKCPCLSGKTFGECCSRKKWVKVPHRHIQIGERFQFGAK